MDATFLLAVLAALAVGAVVALLFLRGRGAAVGTTELAGRLSQMAESQAAVQARISEQLQAQERAVTKALEERLADLSKRVGDRLQESSTRSQNTLVELRERLAVIDQAQKNITELSTQVVGLQDILANKQARGSFGEIQLNDLVENILPPNAYEFQATLSNGRRADCLLKLPNPPGPIAIDSKFPLESYEALREAGDETARAQARRALAADLRTHVQAIATRYIIPGETAESALMFLPSEAVYAELHAAFRSVVEAHARTGRGDPVRGRQAARGSRAARRAGRQAAAPLRTGQRGPAPDPDLQREGDPPRRAHRGVGVRGSKIRRRGDCPGEAPPRR
jgi:DNA recombination protein RmuC